MCSSSVVPLAVSTCMRALYSIWHGGLGGVRSIQVYYLHVCTERAPLEQCLTWLVRAMYVSRSCLYRACTPCTCQHGYCTYLPALVLVLNLYRRTVCTALYLLYIESASPCSYSYYGCTIAQCVPCLYLLYSGLAWLARVTCLFPVFVLVPCLYYGTVSTGYVRFTRFAVVPCCGCTLAQCVPCLYLLPVFVLVSCVYYCTVGKGNVRFTRFVLVPCCGCTIAPCVGNVPFTRFCTRVVRILLHGASTGRVLNGQVRTRVVAVPLHGVYRACTVISSHSCWTSSSLKSSAISFLGLGVEFVYQRFFFGGGGKYKYIYKYIIIYI